MHLSYLPAVAMLALAGCASSSTSTTSSTSNPLFTVLNKISTAGLADIQRVEAVASVPNAGLAGGVEDAHGLACAQAAQGVFTQINAVNTAANGAGAGIMTAGEIASLFQPGSPQFTQAQDTLVAGCNAKAVDVLGPQGVVAAGGVIGAMATVQNILPLVAAAP